MNSRKSILIAIGVFLALVCVAAVYQNRFVTVPDGALINGNVLTNLNGAYLQLNTVNSNKLDAATRAMFGTGGGSPNALTNLDSRSWTNNTGIYGNGIGLTNIPATNVTGLVYSTNFVGATTNTATAGQDVRLTGTTNSVTGTQQVYASRPHVAYVTLTASSATNYTIDGNAGEIQYINLETATNFNLVSVTNPPVVASIRIRPLSNPITASWQTNYVTGTNRVAVPTVSGTSYTVNATNGIGNMLLLSLWKEGGDDSTNVVISATRFP